jgi:hypothetical protein
MRDTLIGMAALHCRLAAMDGHKMDKRAMRYNAMADYMEHGAACGAPSPEEALPTALKLLREAVRMAIIGDPMYTGGPFSRDEYKWMEAA